MSDETFVKLLDSLEAEMSSHEAFVEDLKAQRRPKDEVIAEQIERYEELRKISPAVSRLSREAWAAAVRRHVNAAYYPAEMAEWREQARAMLEAKREETAAE